MATKLITIQTQSGAKEIRAAIIGRFAVHIQASYNDETQEFCFNEEWFSVSHIETGRSVMRIIETQKAALAFARLMNAEFHEGLVERAQAGEDKALEVFSSIIKRWHNDYGAIYSF